MKSFLVGLMFGTVLAGGQAFAGGAATATGDWNGSYVGLSAGWDWAADGTVTNTGTDTGNGGLGKILAGGGIPSSFNLGHNGLTAGVLGGHNWQNDNLIYGIEGDFSLLTGNASASFPITAPGFVPTTTSYSSKLDWLSTLRGRFGVAIDPQLMVFGTGGLALAQGKVGSLFNCPACAPPSATQPSSNTTSTFTSLGWTVGAGAEYRINNNVSLQAEYLYVDLGKHDNTITYTYGLNTSSLTSSFRDVEHIAKLSAVWHF